MKCGGTNRKLEEKDPVEWKQTNSKYIKRIISKKSAFCNINTRHY